ncbi:nuclear transport factor 2 family protein [Gordonia sp. VNK1]|uniref:nuclear transport factor 2 family protein n=1 Tax=Gordonia oleivorans TaxID=3156618 RepID=UPI0032B4F667
MSSVATDPVESIKRLKYRYWRACDAKDPDTFRSCFIRHGARIDYGPLGNYDDADDLVEVFRSIALLRVDGTYAVYDMHHGMHPEITVTGDTTAVGRWSLRFRQVSLLDDTELLMTGDYDDDYVIEDGEWKIAACRFTDRWSMRRPLPPDTVITPGTFVADAAS